MRKEQEKTIGVTKFKVTQLGFEDGIDLMVMLYKSLGPALGVFLKGIEHKKGEAGISMEALSEALAELAHKLNAADLKRVVAVLAKATRIEREPDKWPLLEPELDLAGEYGLLFRWLGFALEVNYASFFAGEAGLGNIAAGLKKMAR